jgi:hypothetical protein
MTGARQLAVLAAALGQQPGLDTPTPAPTNQPLSEVQLTASAAVQTATPAPTAAATLQETPLALADLPTIAPSAMQHPPYELDKVTPVCDPALVSPTLQVQVRDASQQGVPGVGITVTWANGQDAFYTGLKPKMGSGYADFTMQANVQYTLRLTDGGEPISNLASTACKADSGATYAGSLLVEFKQ